MSLIVQMCCSGTAGRVNNPRTGTASQCSSANRGLFHLLEFKNKWMPLSFFFLFFFNLSQISTFRFLHFSPMNRKLWRKKEFSSVPNQSVSF